MGVGEAIPFGKIGRILEQLLEGFEQLEECLGSFFAHWQASLEELASSLKEGIDPASCRRASDATDSSGPSVSGPLSMAQAEAVSDAASPFSHFSHCLPGEPGEKEKLPRPAARVLDLPAGPESSTGNFLALYLVEQLERLQHQRDQLQAQCNQLTLQLAEKTLQAAQLSDLLEQQKRQLLHHQRRWMEHLQLLKPFLDSAITNLTEFAYEGENTLRLEELSDFAPGQSHQILSLPTFRDKKTSIG